MTSAQLDLARIDALRRLRRQRLADRVHRLGARVLFELVDQLARDHGIADDIDALLDRFAHIDHGVLKVAGGDVFPPMPLRLLDRGAA